MTERNDGGAAFPKAEGGGWSANPGMTLRDYFAATAINGLLSSADPNDEWDEPKMAKWAYRMADAMLKERAK